MKRKVFFSAIILLLINLLAFAQDGVEPAKTAESTKTQKSKNVILVSNRWEITLLKAYNTGSDGGGMYKAVYTVRDSKYDPQADEERKYQVRFEKVTSEKSNIYKSLLGWRPVKKLYQDQPQKDTYDVIWSGAPGNIKKFIFIEGTLSIEVDGVKMNKPFSAEIDLDVE